MYFVHGRWYENLIINVYEVFPDRQVEGAIGV